MAGSSYISFCSVTHAVCESNTLRDVIAGSCRRTNRCLSTGRPRLYRVLSTHGGCQSVAVYHMLHSAHQLSQVNHMRCPQQTSCAIDYELRRVLELATDSELLELSNILYGQSLLSPVLKSMAVRYDDGQVEERDEFIERLHSRFLYLAGDAKAILSGRRPTYRAVLLLVKKKLKVQCPVNFSTEDIEAEIFLHLVEQYSRKQETKLQLSGKLLEYIGGETSVKGPIDLRGIVKLGGRHLLTSILKGGSAITVSSLQKLLFRKLSGQLLFETARYQLAKEAVVKTGQMALILESRVAVMAAKQGLVKAVARYLSLRSAMMVLGPMIWGSFVADMAISSVGTDYARVIRAIYVIAQIRLSRAYSSEPQSSGLKFF